MKVSYDWVKEYLGKDAPTAEEIAALLTFHSFEIDEIAELKNDCVIDVDILPNRSSDCLCHRGIAREISTLTNVPLENDPLAVTPTLSNTDLISITVEDEQDCSRFAAVIIQNVTVKESPTWLKERLEHIGQRSINNIVDATNYVMFSLGQPLHAYDADLFPQAEGKWQFGIRRAKEGEQVELLAEGSKEEDRTITLRGGELLIVDNSSNVAIGLAGVKGGRYAGIHAQTKNIIIEAAHFNPILTRKTARALNIVIDASKRFENEPSRELPPYALQEIVALIEDIAGGEFNGMADVYLSPKTPPTVSFRPKRATQVLGLNLTSDKMRDILIRAGCRVEEPSPEEWLLSGPWERTDLCIEEDFIEEVGRINGLDEIQAVVPTPVPLIEVNKRQFYSEKIRQRLIALGFSEVITSSFRKKDEIQLFNALASDKSFLRSNLQGNINDSLNLNLHNKDLLGLPYIAIFEIGTVFTKQDGQVSEHTALAFGVRRKLDAYTKEDKRVMEEAASAIADVLNIESLPVDTDICELNLTKILATLGAPEHYDEVPASSEVAYRPYSSYPAIARDIALWVNEGVSSEQVATIVNEAAGNLRVRTTLFDTFTKDGRTSYAFRLVFQSHNRTLTDTEVNTIMDRVYDAAKDNEFEVR